jgi:hypothetical protein
MKNKNPEPVSSTTNRPYNPNKIESNSLVIQYKAYFYKFLSEFGANYKIWIVEDNLSKLAVGIVNENSSPPIAVTVWLKYGDIPLQHHPLDPKLIKAIKNHLETSTEDLYINHPLQESLLS